MLGLDPKDELSSSAVWEDQALIEGYLGDIYRGVGFGFGSPSMSGGVDEANFNHGWGAPPIRMSNMTPSSRGYWQAAAGRDTFRRFDWGQVYGRIRDLNIFLDNIDRTDAVGQTMKDTLKGEAHFLRGFYYHNLLRVHGGVPLIDTVFELEGDLSQYQVPRNSFAETVDFIVQDLDQATDLLPVEARNPGHATKGAALALKSRVLLFAASDLFAENPSGMPETGYTGGDQMSRWRAAKEAAQAVIDLDQYDLYQGDYEDIWLRGDHDEVIWARYFSPAVGSTYNGQHNISTWSSPNGYNCWGGDCPLQQHVDKYEMVDGAAFDWNNPEHAENPYKNRDPRFHANILYNGREWRERPEGLRGADPRGVIQTGWYEMPGQEELRAGLDTREGPVQDWNGTYTGYYVKKFVDPSIDPNNEQAHNPWLFLRYGEVLLNYAEASAELGEASDAVWALNEIRSRVDMPDVPADGGPDRSLMDRVRNERAVELAFEEHRYFDVRRWMIAPDVYEDGMGIRIEGRLDENGELLVNNRYDYTYEVVHVDERQWNDEAYFVPIPLEEMQRNPELVQNPGYSAS